jgi:glycerophosphoryl diester phosphodiesterase
MTKPFWVCAHRGASGTHPENTLHAFAEAVALGCGMVEFDVRATSDGALVLLHDATVDRTTDGSGNIWELDHQAVLRLDASAGHTGFELSRIPTLDEVLDLLPRAMELNIHVYPGPSDGADIVAGVCERIQARDLYGTAFISGSDEVMELATAQDPQVRRCLLGSQDRAAAYARLAHGLGCSNIQPLNKITTKALCDEAHELDLVVHPFYADDAAEMQRLIDCGVDGILTNQPARLIGLLEKLS